MFALGCLPIVSCGGGGSQGPGPNPGVFALKVGPNPLVIVPNSTITLTVTSSGAPSTPSVTLGTLPAGLSTTTAFPISIPSGGAPITLQAATSLATGSFTVTLNGQAGSATATANISVTVQSTPASFGWAHPLFDEVGVTIGGSGQIQLLSLSGGSANDYDVVLSVSGLPPGTTAAITPPTMQPGASPTITITASSGAPVSQNAVVTLTGTPKAPVPAASTTFLVDVTAPTNSLPDNRTDYVSLDSSPFSAVYDSTHQLIFSSNPSWNRVNVISANTHAILRTIPVQDSRGMDISPDNSRVWVGTGGHQVYEINTTTFTAVRHPLGGLVLPSFFGLASWADNQVFALADGTVMLNVTIDGLGSNQLFIWDPGSNAVTVLTPPGAHSFGLVQRSGDGKRVICFPGDSAGDAFFYDVIAKSFSSVFNIGGQNITGAVNVDGSRIVAGLAMFDGNFNFIGALPDGNMGGPGFEGGTVFSANGQFLYEESLPDFTPLIFTIDANTLNVLNVAPAMPLIPEGFELSPPFFIPIPFAADSTGMIFGRQAYGIAFDDAAFTTHFSTLTPGSPTFLQHMSPLVGPLAGGTTSGGFGNAFSLTPSVWYGANRGTANNAGNDLTITSPPGSAPGPVNVKMLFPDGIEVFNPQFFSYGPLAQFSVLSGASPAGNVTGQIAGFGLPATGSDGTVTVGGASAAITASARVSSIEFVDYPFPANTLSFALPPGSPGLADVTVTTPNGTSLLPKAVFYAASVTDFSSSDTFAAILYDGPRQQLYLAAGNHIDVFSLSANHFLSPLTPPALGSSKNFAGMALTPDGTSLLAADLPDGSLAVIDPDNPATATVIPVAIDTSDPSCTRGPLYVAAGINQQAYVVTGGLPALGCGPGGNLYRVDLVAKSSTVFSNTSCSNEALSGSFVASSHDGTKVAFNTCIYDATLNAFNGFRFSFLNEQAISGDGNVAIGLSAFLHPAFSDASGDITGRVALPDVYYGVIYSALGTTSPLFEPQLNDAGSLLYQAYPPFFDIIDVPHGTLRMRFSLGETVSDVAVPMAIDAGGQHIYLLTNRGLSIVDLGSAPLGIGSLSASTASPGATITVRGSGFNSSTAATVGGQTAAVSFVDENTLMLTVPAIGSGVTNIVLLNNSGTSYTLENALTIP